MKLISWNVNGIRACEKNGLLDFIQKEKADFYCFQETKACTDQLSEELLRPKGYGSYFFSAEKKGYSGVAIYSKKKLEILEGMGVPEFDREGRVIQADLGNAVLINAYFPNSQRDHARLDYKLGFCEAYEKLVQKWVKKEKKHVLLCGDFNIAHEAIDLANPKTNENNAGFLPEERAWMTRFLNLGYLDTFRDQNKTPGNYTWWSYRPGVREKNIGWRIDYWITNSDLKSEILSSTIQPEIQGSDHCPVAMKVDL